MTLEQQPASRTSQGRSWQLAAYIVLALAMLGSLPSLLRVYRVYTLGVTWEQVPFALQQKALWQRNEMCASMPGEQTPFSADAQRASEDRTLGSARQVATFSGMAVRLQGCWNGDVLVRTVIENGTGRAVWVAAEGFTLEAAGLSIADRALAQSRPVAPGDESVETFSVMCQDWDGGTIDSGRVIRVVSVGDNCARETINILTGKVERSEVVPCDAGCAADEAE
ncbi:MAG: hypothetical protein ACLFPA_04310 [Dichotomicrobium sp.]